MALTYRPVDALIRAKHYTKDLPLTRTGLGLEILQNAHRRLWMAADWEWTLDLLQTSNLESKTEDYEVTTPADFLKIAHTMVKSGSNIYWLTTVPFLPSIGGIVVGTPRLIAHIDGDTDYLRIFPAPADQPTVAQRMFTIYKKIAPVLTAETQYSTGVLLIKDEWSWVFEELVLLEAYRYGFDNRAGSVQINSEGQVQYSGQEAVIRDAIATMREGLPDMEKYMSLEERISQEA